MTIMPSLLSVNDIARVPWNRSGLYKNFAISYLKFVYDNVIYKFWIRNSNTFVEDRRCNF